MRADETAARFVADFARGRKPIASICHGPWILVEAGIVRGRTITSWPSLKTDVHNAGGTWVDDAVDVDRGLVTSRKPDDLPAFNAKAIEEYAEGAHEDMPQPAGAAPRRSVDRNSPCAWEGCLGAWGILRPWHARSGPVRSASDSSPSP